MLPTMKWQHLFEHKLHASIKDTTASRILDPYNYQIIKNAKDTVDL